MHSTIIWLAAVSFLLFQFFLQLSSGIVIESIMLEQNLSGFTAGLLSSSFYYVYTSLQIPVGMLFDRYNTRNLLAFNAGICAIGCFFFSLLHSLGFLFLGRLIIGTGSAFAFVGVAHILRRYFPLRNYAFMIGLSETLGFTVTVFGMILMGWIISLYGWRSFISIAGVLGLLIALFLRTVVPDNKATHKKNPISMRQLAPILKNKLAWINGLFVCLEFSVVTVFAALWAVPFLEIKLNCTLQESNILTSILFLGTAVSCPLFGYLASSLSKRKPLIHFSCLFTALLLLVIIFVPIHSHLLIGLLMFTIGLSCGAYMLAFSIATELAPKKALSTCTGFTNTLAMLSATIMQPLIGYLLDKVADQPGVYALKDYQLSLLVIPLGLVFASLLVTYLPEKPSAHLSH